MVKRSIVASPKVLEGQIFEFKRSIAFCLGHCLSKHKTRRYARNFGGHDPPSSTCGEAYFPHYYSKARLTNCFSCGMTSGIVQDTINLFSACHYVFADISCRLKLQIVGVKTNQDFLRTVHPIHWCGGYSTGLFAKIEITTSSCFEMRHSLALSWAVIGLWKR